MNLADRVWWTKKTRIQTEKRLLKQDFLAQLMLLWYAVFSVFASIYEISKPAQNSLFTALMITLSVMVMGVTLFIGSRNFKERAMLVKQCYEQLSELNTRVNDAITSNNKPQIGVLEVEYKNILNVCENHSDIDYKKAIIFEYLNSDEENRKKLTKKPNWFHYLVAFALMTLNILVYITFTLLPLGAWYFSR